MQTCSRVQVKINTNTAIVLHQFCSPCLVLPVGGRASKGGGGRVAGGKQSTRVDFDRS